MLNGNIRTELKPGVATAQSDDRRESLSVMAAFVACFAAIAFALIAIATAPLSNVTAPCGADVAAAAAVPEPLPADAATPVAPEPVSRPERAEPTSGNVVDMTY